MASKLKSFKLKLILLLQLNVIADVQAVGKVHAAFVECLHGLVQLCTPLVVHMYVSVHMHEVVCVPVCVCPCLYAST